MTVRRGSQLTGTSKILGPTWSQLPALSVGLLGVQVLWSVEMSYASPYLLSLGLKKSLMAIVFLAGPLSGLIMQPLIGVLADTSKSRFGRRRPYMLLGTLLSVFALLLLGFTRQFAALFTAEGSPANDSLTIWLAILAIYIIDFSVNAVQPIDRALIVDTLPPTLQSSGTAWAARMLSLGSVLGFFVGTSPLPTTLPFLGHTELQILSLIASFLLLLTHGITALCVKERVLLGNGRPPKGLRAELKLIWENLFTLPHLIRQICIIQFFAWLAWFPILFYTTLYISEIHARSLSSPSSSSSLNPSTQDQTEEGVRLGARALLYHALISLLANFVLPFFVAGAEKVKKPSRWRWWPQVRLETLWAASHLLFAVCMAGTVFVSTVTGATFLMSLTGFSWAITQWAPFSLLGEAIRSSSPTLPTDHIMLSDTRSRRPSDAEEETRFLVGEDEENDGLSERVRSARSSESLTDEGAGGSMLRNAEARFSSVDVHALSEEEVDGGERARDGDANDLSSKAGIILGIHNIFIVIPQFLVTGLSSIIFAILEPDKSVLHPSSPLNQTTSTIQGESTSNPLLPRADEGDDPWKPDGPDSVAIIFRLGGVAAAVAFILSYRLSKELRHR